MPICFWSRCHCPDNQPCVEHTGLGCSILNGVAITDVTQVADANTRAGEVALGRLGVDTQRAEAIVRDLEARKAELERERDDLERMARDADSMSERRAVVERERQIARRYQNLSNELVAITDEITALGDSAQVAVAPLSAALRIPYSDPAGYCTCYQAKLDQLDAIANQITAEQAAMAQANAAFNSARTLVLPKLRFTFTIAAGVVILIFIILGVGAGWVIAAFVALMFTAITVLGLAAQMGSRRGALLASRTRLYKLWLSYYRIQVIPTCIRPPIGDEEEEDHGHHRPEEEDGEKPRPA